MIVCVSALRARAVWVLSSVRDNHAWTIVLKSKGTLLAVCLQACGVHGTYANTVSYFDARFCFIPNADSLAYDFVADAYCCTCSSMEKRQSQSQASSLRYGVCDFVDRISSSISFNKVIFAVQHTGPCPERSVCKSVAQMPQCEISMSTSVSSKALGLNSCQTSLPFAESLSKPIHPSNL